jgi:zinc/manganese transport system substrate-binding protein
MRVPATMSAIFVTCVVIAGCGSSDGTNASQATSDGGLSVGTTTMLGDVLSDIEQCAGGTAETLMPRGVDPHDFSASSAQIARLVSAQLVVANGLGLEEGIEDALESAAADGASVFEVAPLVDPIEFSAGAPEDHDHSDEEHSDGGDAHEQDSLDPHFWHDAARMAQAAEIIGAELAERTGDEAYATCGTEVYDAIMQADEEVREILAVVPDDRRVLVTDHDALGYFADAYDFEVVGVVIPGGATLAEPSSQELAELVETLDREGVTAIFSNNASPTDLVSAVAAEAGADVEVVELFLGSLGPEGSGAETYVGMVTTNAERIAAALD